MRIPEVLIKYNHKARLFEAKSTVNGAGSGETNVVVVVEEEKR